MKLQHHFTLLLLILLGTSCTTDDAVDTDNQTKILPLGASRVEGNPPSHHSYRYHLWKHLLENNLKFDFIGTQNDENQFPDFLTNQFDPQHEGHSGRTSSSILKNLPETLLEIEIPDIVLFSSPGGNDLLTNQSYELVLENINAIIDTFQNYNPNVTVVIELIAPGSSLIMSEQRTIQFNQIREDVLQIAKEQSTTNSQVLTVDMGTDFSSDFLADPIHYNEEGAKFVAERYYEVLRDLLRE